MDTLYLLGYPNTKTGDIIPGYGRVDTNHVVAPWVCTVDGNLAFGVVHVVHGGLHDARTGTLLSNEEGDWWRVVACWYA